MTDIIVIGAGIAGLLGAHALRDGGHHVTVLDKSFVPGGRIATKTVAGATFDIGAQFLTARTPTFQSHVDRWLAQGVLRTWFHGSPDRTAPAEPDGYPRYRGSPTMRRIAEHLAVGLDVRLGAVVTEIAPVDGRWRITVAGREPGPGPGTTALTADAVLLTTPVPQALTLLEAGGTAPSPETRRRLAPAEYAPTISVLATPAGPTVLPSRGAIRIPGGEVEWITDNRVTGASTVPAVTVHAGTDLSRSLADASDAEVADIVLAAARDVLGCAASGVHVHRWRYARPTATLGADPLVEVVDGAPLAFAGDAFHGGRLEGAALSGLASATALSETLAARMTG